jgi:hypothetical protein
MDYDTPMEMQIGQTLYDTVRAITTPHPQRSTLHHDLQPALHLSVYLMVNHSPGSEKTKISIFIIAIVFLITGSIAGFMAMPKASESISGILSTAVLLYVVLR